MKSRIKQLRKDLSLTQEQFAKKIDLSRSNYASAETGAVTLTERNIKRISKEFNVSESWIRTGEGEMVINVESDKDLIDFMTTILADKNELARNTFLTLAKLNESEWDIVAKMISGLKK